MVQCGIGRYELTSQQHAGVSQGPTCPHKCACCHTGIEAAEQTCCLMLSYVTEAGPTSARSDPVMPRAWQASPGVLIFKSLVSIDLKKPALGKHSGESVNRANKTKQKQTNNKEQGQGRKKRRLEMPGEKKTRVKLPKLRGRRCSQFVRCGFTTGGLQVSEM